MLHRRSMWALAAAALVCSAQADAAGSRTALVTTARDAGAGSFRAAVALANADPSVTRIVFGPKIAAVPLTETVTYTGAQALTIDGLRVVLDGRALATGAVLRAIGGGDLALRALTVLGGPAEGVDIEVPATATGTIRIWLGDVDIIGNRGHGVLINDQVDSSTTDGMQPNAAGSAASVDVTVLASRLLRNGFSVSDRDGLRVNEGGPGDLSLTARLVVADDNAADGIELDERGAGDVHVDVLGARLTRNGAFDPDDLDDGFDIDEYDDGSIIGIVALTAANDNFEEGLDFNENNTGDLHVNLAYVEASRNGEEGIDYEEDDDFAGGGDLAGWMVGVVANGNGRDGGDAGLKIREKGTGELAVDLKRVATVGNLIGGVSVREDAIGSLTATVVDGTSTGNVGHGFDFDENRASTSDVGNLTATVNASVSTGNTGVGVRADQQTPGTGVATLANVTLTGNTGGATTGGGVTFIVTP